MLNYISGFIDFSRRTKLPMINFNRYVTQIKRKKDLTLFDLPNFKGMKEIEMLMSKFNLYKLIDIQSDFDRLNYLIEKVAPVFNSFIRVNQDKFEYKTPTFIDLNGMSRLFESTQVLLLSNESNYFKFLPLGSKSLKRWYDASPIQITYHNSPEYTTYMNRGTISFSSISPNYFIICLDIILLLMHYSKISILMNEPLSVELYIKDFLWSSVQDDMKNIWIMNLFYSTLEKVDIGDDDQIIRELKDEYLSHNKPYYSFLKTEFEDSVKDIVKLVLECSIGKIYPETVLNSIKLTNNMSIIENIKDISEKFYFEEYGNTRWVSFLRDIFYIKLLLRVFKLQPRYSETKNLIVYLRSTILIYKNSRFWSYIKNPSLRKKVEEEVLEIEKLFYSIQ